MQCEVKSAFIENKEHQSAKYNQCFTNREYWIKYSLSLPLLADVFDSSVANLRSISSLIKVRGDGRKSHRDQLSNDSSALLWFLLQATSLITRKLLYDSLDKLL